MLVLESDENYIYTIKKSKFIGMMFAVFSKEECEEKIESIKEQYKDANHVCYAYILSEPTTEKCFDDGEPKGTAGLPMLNALKKQKLQNVLVVVVRYFGGIKLGSGGLIKAYMETCIGLIKKADFVKYTKYYIYEITAHLYDMQAIENYCNASGFFIRSSNFTKIAGKVVYNIAVNEELSEDKVNYLHSLNADIKQLPTKFISEKEIK